MPNNSDKGGISEGDFAGTRKGKKGRDPMDVLKGMFASKSVAKGGAAPGKAAASAKSMGYTMNKDGTFTKVSGTKAKSGKMGAATKPAAKKRGK